MDSETFFFNYCITCMIPKGRLCVAGGRTSDMFTEPSGTQKNSWVLGTVGTILVMTIL